VDISPEALERLRGYSWPGNIRELQSVLKQALLQATGPILLPAFLPVDLPVEGPSVEEHPLAPHFRVGASLVDLERTAIQQCLLHTHGNRQQTAGLLGISTRTLLRKIREYGLKDPLQFKSDSDN
jgi:two-component system nitrogen regulation response regulator GlnG